MYYQNLFTPNLAIRGKTQLRAHFDNFDLPEIYIVVDSEALDSDEHVIIKSDVLDKEAKEALRDALIKETKMPIGLANSELCEEVWEIVWRWLGGYMPALDERTARAILLSAMTEAARNKEEADVGRSKG